MSRLGVSITSVSGKYNDSQFFYGVVVISFVRIWGYAEALKLNLLTQYFKKMQKLKKIPVSNMTPWKGPIHQPDFSVKLSSVLVIKAVPEGAVLVPPVFAKGFVKKGLKIGKPGPVALFALYSGPDYVCRMTSDIC